MKKEYDDKETLCEIVNLLNKSDLKLLCMINDYIEKGSREYYEKNIEKNKKQDEEDKNDSKHLYFKFKDRNLIVDDKNTIFWKDFEKYYELQAGEMGFILLGETIDKVGIGRGDFNISKEILEWL